MEEVSNPSMRFSLGNLDSLGMLMQHNPQQADAPNLPPDVLQKVLRWQKMMPLDDLQSMPKS